MAILVASLIGVRLSEHSMQKSRNDSQQQP